MIQIACSAALSLNQQEFQEDFQGTTTAILFFPWIKKGSSLQILVIFLDLHVLFDIIWMSFVGAFFFLYNLWKHKCSPSLVMFCNTAPKTPLETQNAAKCLHKLLRLFLSWGTNKQFIGFCRNTLFSGGNPFNSWILSVDKLPIFIPRLSEASSLSKPFAHHADKSAFSHWAEIHRDVMYLHCKGTLEGSLEKCTVHHSFESKKVWRRKEIKVIILFYMLNPEQWLSGVVLLT